MGMIKNVVKSFVLSEQFLHPVALLDPAKVHTLIFLTVKVHLIFLYILTILITIIRCVCPSLVVRL